MELQVLQVQTGDPGSGTEAHNLRDLWAVFAHILAKRAERKRLSNSRTWASCVGDEETPILEWWEQPPSLVWFSLFLVEFLLIERETVSHLIGKHPLYLRQG